MIERVDVCVVGGGIIGMFAALELAQKGYSVRLIDKVYIGSSRFNIGEVLLQGNDAEVSALLQHSNALWKEAAQQYGTDLGFESRGSIDIALTLSDEKRLQEEVQANLKTEWPTKYIKDLETLSQVMGDVRLGEDVIGGEESTDDGVVDTPIAIDYLRKLLVQNGVRIWGSDMVKEFLIVGNKVMGVRTAEGDECQAGTTIVAAGVWSSHLLKTINVNLPQRPARCHLALVSPNGRMPKQIVFHDEGEGHLIIKHRPNRGNTLISYTGIMDPAQATWSKDVDEEAIVWMLDMAGHILEPLKFAEVIEEKCVLLAITPDNKPFVGPYPGVEGLQVAIGFNGRSFAYAAGCADWLHRSIVDNNQPLPELKPISPDRLNPKPWESLGDNPPTPFDEGPEHMGKSEGQNFEGGDHLQNAPDGENGQVEHGDHDLSSEEQNFEGEEHLKNQTTDENGNVEHGEHDLNQKGEASTTEFGEHKKPEEQAATVITEERAQKESQTSVEHGEHNLNQKAEGQGDVEFGEHEKKQDTSSVEHGDHSFAKEGAEGKGSVEFGEHGRKEEDNGSLEHGDHKFGEKEGQKGSVEYGEHGFDKEKSAAEDWQDEEHLKQAAGKDKETGQVVEDKKAEEPRSSIKGQAKKLQEKHQKDTKTEEARKDRHRARVGQSDGASKKIQYGKIGNK